MKPRQGSHPTSPGQSVPARSQNGFTAPRQFRIRASPPKERRIAPEPGLLQELALAHGIQLSYTDMNDRVKTASAASVRALLGSMGVPAANPRECSESLRETHLELWRRSLAPVLVAWDGTPTKVPVRLPAELPRGGGRLKFRLEDGTSNILEWAPANWRVLGRAKLDGRDFVECELCLPPLPFGLHTLQFELGNRQSSSVIISAPARAYSPPELEKTWGVFVPMYAIHSGRSWGAGNIGDFEQLITWIHSLGGRVTATLPLLAAFLGKPHCEPSPYSPVSRLFWNEFFIDIQRIPEFSTCVKSKTLHRQLRSFRSEPFVDYAEEMTLRRKVLEQLAQSLLTAASSRRTEFETFVERHPEVRDYAEFRATCEQQDRPWRFWDGRMRWGKLQPGDFRESARNYHLYCQWIIHEQMHGMLEQCRRHEIRFHLDLPLGVHPDGYDTWRRQDTFALSASVGAPPDMFFTKGQNWGFPPLHPRRIRESGYSYILDYLRFQMRHTTLLRLDHVMGLHRLYWIPPKFPADQGCYVTYPAQEFYALLCLESQRHKTVLVGENLGTVPPEVTRAMARHGLRETYVAQYSHQTSKSRPLKVPPVRSIAMLNTHDMPTFAAHSRGEDIRARVSSGLISTAEASRTAQERQRNLTVLRHFLQRHGWLRDSADDPAVFAQATLAWLASTRAETVLINIEDLWGETRPQNVPGLVLPNNWRRKTRLSLKEIERCTQLRDFLRHIHRLRKRAQGVTREPGS